MARMCVPCWINTQVAIVETESIRKVSDSGVSSTVDQVGASTTCRCGAPEGIRTPNLLIRRLIQPVPAGLSASAQTCSIALLSCGFNRRGPWESVAICRGVLNEL
jgi:hypothetical protein